jgi:uncharacterized membrane protein required for colicin V production
MNLNGLDVIIVLVLIAGCLLGWAQGLLRQLLGLAGFYVALVLAAQYHRPVAQTILHLANGAVPVAIESISFLVIFGLGTLLFTWLGRQVYTDTHLSTQRVLDALGGVAFGTFSSGLECIIGLTMLRFVLSADWFLWEPYRQAILAAYRTADLPSLFLVSAPSVFNLIQPWLPTGLPGIFVY